MSEKEKTKKNDFISIEFTGFSEGNIFDSNNSEDIKKINQNAKPKELIIAIGQGMVVKGLDKALEDKELEKNYEIKLSPNESFGLRDRNLIKTIPLKVFHAQKISPFPGLVLSMDNNLVKVIAVSGARVIADFNNPLSGKEITYKFKILKIINDEKQKSESLFKYLLGFAPEFEIYEKEIIAKGKKPLDVFINALSQRFKELIGKDLKFQEIQEESKEKEEIVKEN